MAALSPSDLHAQHAGQCLRVAGRISRVSGAECTLADALASLSVALRAAADLRVGELATIEGQFDGEVLCAAEVVARIHFGEPRGDGDLARFAWQGVGRNLEARARALAAVRGYFAREAFLEVETPFRVPAPGVDLHLDAFPAHGGYLIASPELHMKRLLAAGFPRLFQIARVSRQGEFGALHEPEFTMLEWYRSFAGLEQVLSDTERLVREVATAVCGKPNLTGPDGRSFDLNLPFPRLTVREAFQQHAGIADAVDLALTDEARYFQILVEQVEPALARQNQPLFLWKYPANQAALARLSEADPSVAERFELYVGGVELCNGFDELTDAAEQRQRFARDNLRRTRDGRLTYPTDERFLAALESGMPPSGGNALGFDRLVMLATGAREVSEVIAFPAHTL